MWVPDSGLMCVADYMREGCLRADVGAGLREGGLTWVPA